MTCGPRRDAAPSTGSWMSRATTVTARTFIYDTSRSSISTPIQTEVASTPMSSLAVDHLQTSSQFGHLRLLSGRTCSVVCADRFVAHHDADAGLETRGTPRGSCGFSPCGGG